MRRQSFESMIAGEPSLLRLVEKAIIDAHRRRYALDGRVWTEPAAYRWLRYEDPDPIARLTDGLIRIVAEGGEVDAGLAGRAVASARELGYSE